MNTLSEIRIYGSSDWHIGKRKREEHLKEGLQETTKKADILLLAGDITDEGLEEQAIAAASILKHATVPIYAVTGNHDARGDVPLLEKILTEEAGVTFLHGEVFTQDIRGKILSITGTTGWFEHYVTGNRATTKEGWLKQKYRHRHEVRQQARGIAKQQTISADYKIVLDHFVPSKTCVHGDKDRHMYSDKLGNIIDAAGDINFVAFGHEHSGLRDSYTRRGTRAYNLALEVIQRGLGPNPDRTIIFRELPLVTIPKQEQDKTAA